MFNFISEQPLAVARATNSGGVTHLTDWLVVGCALLTLNTGAACGSGNQPGPPVSLQQGLNSPAGDESAPVPNGQAWFRDVTENSGLLTTYRNGEEANHFSLLETLGGGVALIDYDNDGLLDVFVTGGGHFGGPDGKELKGHPCRLFKNLGDFKFADVTPAVGLADISWWYTHGAAVADYDCDGWSDLVVSGYGRLALFHNERDAQGGRRFADVTKKTALNDESWSTSAGWADLDGDGFPELYVCHYVDWSFNNDVFCPGLIPGVEREVCSPKTFKPLVHALFQNEAGQAFHDVSRKHGVKPAGSGLGVVLADLNDDGRPDVFVTNDMTPNFLYYNRTGELEEKAALAGVAVDELGRPNGNMGVDVGDYDGSGRPSLWVTVFQNEQHVLARNLGGEIFLSQSRAAGIGAIGQHFVAFGTGFIDVDNDGWEDLVFVNGQIVRHPAGGDRMQRPVLLHNVAHQGRRFFRDASAQGGVFFQTPAMGRGLAIGDLDNDGWPDLVVSHVNSPLALLRNQTAERLSTPRGWLGVRLRGRENRDVVGATVTLLTDTRSLTRFAKGGGSYLSSNDRRLLFGLDASVKARRLTVKWPWGEAQTWENLDPNHYWELVEGEPMARVLTAQSLNYGTAPTVVKVGVPSDER